MRGWAVIILTLIFTADVPAAAQAGAQATISGVVLHADTGSPIPAVHVFLAGTTRGATTDEQGTFRMHGVPPGAYRIVISSVGFASTSVDTLLRARDTLVLEILLREAVLQLPAVEIKADRPARWLRRLRAFERMFIGESELASGAQLLNPEVLEFEGGWGRLRAVAHAPLEIENRSLGYHLRYHLTEFERRGSVIRYDGDPLFTPLDAKDAEEARRWREQRCRTYFGSFRHFMESLLDGVSRDAGFHLVRRAYLRDDPHRTGIPVTPDRLVSPGDEHGLHTLRFGGYLEVTYRWKEEEALNLRRTYSGRPPPPSAQRSWLRLKSRQVQVDAQGEPTDPYAITLYGSLAFQRAGDLLPREYQPPDGVTRPSECGAAAAALSVGTPAP